MLVLSLPGDGGLGVASRESNLISGAAAGSGSPGLAVEADAGALHGDRVVAGLVVQNVRRLDNLGF